MALRDRWDVILVLFNRRKESCRFNNAFCFLRRDFLKVNVVWRRRISVRPIKTCGALVCEIFWNWGKIWIFHHTFSQHYEKDFVCDAVYLNLDNKFRNVKNRHKASTDTSILFKMSFIDWQSSQQENILLRKGRYSWNFEDEQNAIFSGGGRLLFWAFDSTFFHHYSSVNRFRYFNQRRHYMVAIESPARGSPWTEKISRYSSCVTSW